MTTASFHNTTRMADPEVRKLLWNLAAKANVQRPERPVRAEERIYQQIISVPVSVSLGRGNTQTFRAPMLDLCTRGAGFVFGRFVHPGATIKAALITVQDYVDIVDGSVRWCALHKGHLHRVGVMWDRPLDLSRYARINTTQPDNLDYRPLDIPAAAA